MEIEDSIPQILLNLIQTSTPNSCLLCNSPHTITIPKPKKAPISKNWKVSYTHSFCQFLNLDIPEDLESPLDQAAYCEKCLQLVLDIHFLRTGIQAYEHKLKSLKLETEQLLYGLVVKSESNPQSLHDADEADEFHEPVESIFPNFTLENEEYPQNFVSLDLKPKLPKPKVKSKPKFIVRVEPQPTFTRSGRRVSKPKEFQLDPLRTSSDSEGDDNISADEPFQETNGSSESEDSEFEVREPKSPSTLKNVSKSKYPKNPLRFSCLICTKSYYAQKCLYRHYVTHYKELENYKETVPAEIVQYVQNYLGLSKSKTGSSAKKSTNRHSKDWKCTQCTRVFWTPDRLEAHLLRDHLKESPKLKCFLCSRLFYIQEYLSDHYRTSHSESDLTESQKEELDPKILELIKKTKKCTPWSQRKTFPCDQCSMIFSRSSILEAHVQRTHLNAHPTLLCKLCPKLFYSEYYLRDHYRKTHVEADIAAAGLGKDEIPPEILNLVMKPTEKESGISFPCVICNKIYTVKKSVYRHYVSHWDELENYKKAITPEILEIVEKYKKKLESAQSENDPDSEPPAKRKKTKNTSKSKVQEKVKTKVRFPCLICPKVFNTQGKLNIHYQKGHREKDIPGGVEIPPEVLSLLKRPKLKHKNVPPKLLKPIPATTTYPCQKCAKTFPTKKGIWSHKQYAHGEYVEKPSCSVCGKMFKTEEEVSEHENLHKGSRSPFTCVLCPEETAEPFQSKRELFRHVLGTHESDDNIFRCPHCPRIVLTDSRLRQHIREHHKPKSHVCEICGFKGSTPYRILEHHRAKHSLDKPYKCDVEGCGKAFKQKLVLVRHRNSVHAALEDQFFCKICAKSFKTQSSLESHSVYHLDLRPFVCEICSASFKTIRNLKTHFKVHEKNDSSYTFKTRRARLPEGEFVAENFPNAPKASKFTSM